MKIEFYSDTDQVIMLYGSAGKEQMDIAEACRLRNQLQAAIDSVLVHYIYSLEAAGETKLRDPR